METENPRGNPSKRGHDLTSLLRRQAADDAILREAAAYSLEYRSSIATRSVFPSPAAIHSLDGFREPLPPSPTPPRAVLDQLHRTGSPATVAQTGGLYFGFVNGGILPAALAARWLADTWDQNAAMHVISPVASVLEEVSEGWLVGLLGLPAATAAGFVSGTTTATLCGLAAGRDTLARRLGWDITELGLAGAPPLRVILGEQAHASVYKAISLLGLGKSRVEVVPADGQGRLDANALPPLDDHCLVILQAGNVATGAFDPLERVATVARAAGCWVHVDGAFGLWAAASPRRKHLVRGLELADSWSADAHKTLNTPYDNGLIFCRDRESLAYSLRMTGAYIPPGSQRDGMAYTPEMSRRARGVEVWAALKTLGASGVGDLVDHLCDTAKDLAERLRAEGFTIENEVCFNQVLVTCGSQEATRATLEHLQRGGVIWAGPTTWKGRAAIRVSVSSYMTGPEEVVIAVRAFGDARDGALATG